MNMGSGEGRIDIFTMFVKELHFGRFLVMDDMANNFIQSVAVIVDAYL